MGQIKGYIKKAGFPTSLVTITSQGSSLIVYFPVMGGRGDRELQFPIRYGHMAIAKEVIKTMEWDVWFNSDQ